jgi:PLP dependent protein
VPLVQDAQIRTRINHIKQELKEFAGLSPLAKAAPTLIAVSKGHGKAAILQAIAAGITHFGENRVQEADEKWPEIKAAHPNVTLHLIGPLQTNKARDAVRLFDVIQTLDRLPLAEALLAEMQKQAKKLPCFIQINTGEEAQKAGVFPTQADECIAQMKAVGMDICGLMCIPPLGMPPAPHFALLRQIAKRNDVSELSMGMSADYLEAARFGATYVRIGTAIFGNRG